MGQICKKYDIKEVDKSELKIEQSPQNKDIKFIEDFEFISGLNKGESSKKISIQSFQHKNNSSNYPYGESMYQGSLFSVVTPDFSAISSKLIQ
ncbi:unnamed protein product [Paramecium sonneborni]|uniref:Uncharacterized protein n=1 Tax=Paramecium sonneborni TaxID=65129 RepID=A0A8S1PPI2_9CILI|nr:unnamed protein product [Paramecium sonneborni]